MDHRTGCYSLVWENPDRLYVAIRKSLRFERDFHVPNIPIEISSEVFSLESQKSCYLNPCHDAHVILMALKRTARHYRSVTIFNKGEPCVRWTNSSYNKTGSSIDLVVDSSDVVNKMAQEQADLIGRWMLFFNFFVFIVIAAMFVQLVWGSNEMRLMDYI